MRLLKMEYLFRYIHAMKCRNIIKIQKKMNFIHIKDNSDDINHISQTEIES